MGFQDAARDQPLGREEVGTLELTDGRAIAIGTADLKRPILKAFGVEPNAQGIKDVFAQKCLRTGDQINGSGTTGAAAQKVESVVSRHRAPHQPAGRKRASASEA